MPTRKQRRRDAKSKRHEYEFVYVDDEGNELDEVPEENSDEPSQRANGKAVPAKKPPAKQPQGRGGRGGRTPQPPSWRRSVKRAVILGAVVLVFLSLTGKGNNRYAVAVPFAALYTILFIPFTYAIDRFAYRRWVAREAAGPRTAKQAGSKKQSEPKQKKR